MGIVGMTSTYFSPKCLDENESHTCTSQVTFSHDHYQSICLVFFLTNFLTHIFLQTCPLFHESIRSIGDASDPTEQNDVRKGVLELLSEVNTSITFFFSIRLKNGFLFLIFILIA